MTTCRVGSCARPVRARGVCKSHWARWSRHGDPELVMVRGKLVRHPDLLDQGKGTKAPCDVAGCSRVRYARGLCQTHYRRLRRRGDVFADVPIGEPLPEPEPDPEPEVEAEGCEECGSPPWPRGARWCRRCVYEVTDRARAVKERRKAAQARRWNYDRATA